MFGKKKVEVDSLNGILGDFLSLKERLTSFVEVTDSAIIEKKNELLDLESDATKAKKSLEQVQKIIGE